MHMICSLHDEHMLACPKHGVRRAAPHRGSISPGLDVAQPSLHSHRLVRTMAVSCKATVVLQGLEDVLATVRRYAAAFLFIGHGSVNSYANIQQVLKLVDNVAETNNALYGKEKWLAIFGGDPNVAERPSIGTVVAHLGGKWNVPVLAVQCDEWTVDPYVTFAFYYPTCKDSIGRTLFGGTDENGHLAGATAVYLSDGICAAGLRGVYTFGGGKISVSEMKYASTVLGLPILYTQCEAAVRQDEGQPYFGEVHEYGKTFLTSNSQRFERK